MILFENHTDPAFRYEGLVRTVFNDCKKYGDPWSYAAQDFYANFVNTPNQEGKRALATVIIKIIIDHPQSEQVEQLKLLEDSVWEAKSQDDIITIINKAIDICGQLDY